MDNKWVTPHDTLLETKVSLHFSGKHPLTFVETLSCQHTVWNVHGIKNQIIFSDFNFSICFNMQDSFVEKSLFILFKRTSALCYG